MNFSKKSILPKKNDTRMHSARGFTLIETLVGSTVFVLVALASYNAFTVLMDAVNGAQAKVAATTVANEQFEIIRNIAYEDVGIMGGIPVGKIQRNQTIERDGYSFLVNTTIRNTDDPFDGTIGGNPSDLSPADYKLADLDITCLNCKVFSPIKFTTLVAPRALETASTNGALFIQIFDVNGLPIPNANVHIVNTQTNPDTIIDETTDNSGWVKIIDAPPGTNAYNITATKSGYTTDQTYPLGGAAGSDPVNPDSTVVIQQVTQTSLAIDRVSTLNVSSVDATCTALPNIEFSLTGSKLIGNPDVSKYGTQNFSTDGAGILALHNLEWDTYLLALTSSAYDIAGSSILPTFNLQPNEVKDLQIVTIPHVDHSMLVSVTDPNGIALDGATVRLEGAGFDESKTTNSSACPTPGQVFWNSLTSGTYTMTVSKTGYQTDVSSVPISGWQNQKIILNP